VVAIGEDVAASPPDHPIDRVGEARADRHHAACERVVVARLDDEMRVVALQRVVDEAKTGPDARDRKRALDGVDDPHGPERWEARLKPEGDVCRHGSGERLPSSVRQPGIRTRLATSASATAAPPPRFWQR